VLELETTDHELMLDDERLAESSVVGAELSRYVRLLILFRMHDIDTVSNFDI
jgi:hypothetical protein